MKKNLLLPLALLMCTAAGAQNVQFHYDFGRAIYDDISERPNVTTTVEMFKADKWGSTYFFTDIEYNGGMSSDKHLSMPPSRFQHAVLVGPAWNWASKDFSKTFSVQLMYKYYFKGAQPYQNAYNGFQLTEVWSVTFAHKLCTFSGFADLWYDKRVNGNLIFTTEPQFWFNLNTIKGMDGVNLSLGTEVEISNNFVYNDMGRNNKLYAIPTIAAKWTF